MDRKSTARNWLIGIVVATTATLFGLQTVSAPSQASDSIPVTETVTLASEGCAYSWAYQDAPEVTQKIDSAVKEIQAQSSASATLFGENCGRADGTTTFGAIETDFKVRLPVEDLTQHEAFGNWMKQVMQVMLEIPRGELPGPNYGFVEFWFEKSESEQIVLRVSIQQYLNEAQEKNGIELFEFYYQP